MKKLTSLLAWLMLAGCSAHMHGCGYDFDYGDAGDAARPEAEEMPAAEPALS